MALGPARPQVELAGAEKLGNEVRWVSVSPAYLEKARRNARYAAWLAPVFLGVIVVLLLFVFGLNVLDDAKVRAHLVTTTLALLAFAVLTPFAAKRTRQRLAQYRIGSSSAGLSFQGANSSLGGADRPGRVPWRDVCFDGNVILAGRKQLRVRLPQNRAWIFDPEELRKAILVNIPKENLLTPGELQMRMMGPLAWVFVAALLGTLAWLLVEIFARG